MLAMVNMSRLNITKLRKIPFLLIEVTLVPCIDGKLSWHPFVGAQGN